MLQGGVLSCCFFCKQKTAYELRISDLSSDVCSSDLIGGQLAAEHFIATGRRHIAFVGPQQSPQRQFDERRDGFTAALAAHGLAPVVAEPPDRKSTRLNSSH